MSQYIISDNDNIVGCFDTKINAIIYLLDSIIGKFKFYLELVKINGNTIVFPKLNTLKLTSVENNSTIIKSIDEFDLSNFKLKNIITGENEFISSNSDNNILIFKTNILKKTIQDISCLKNNVDMNIFIPNDALNTEILNNIIINSPHSSELNCIDNKSEKNSKAEQKPKEWTEIDIEKFKKEKSEKLEKEKKEEFKRRYESDKAVFSRLKDEIEGDNIPELFIDQYPIMIILEKLNILDKEEGFEFYYKKMEYILKNKPNVYSNMFNDSSYFYNTNADAYDSCDSDFELNDEINETNI